MIHNLSFLRGKRGIVIIISLVIGVLLLLLDSKTENKTDSKNEYDNDREIYYSEYMEKKIADFLMEVKGINNVQVFVTVDGGNEYEYAQKGYDNGVPADYLIIDTDGGEEPAVIRQIYSRLRGVGVICTNGDHAEVKEEITTLLSAALGISSNKIKVSSYG